MHLKRQHRPFGKGDCQAPTRVPHTCRLLAQALKLQGQPWSIISLCGSTKLVQAKAWTAHSRAGGCTGAHIQQRLLQRHHAECLQAVLHLLSASDSSTNLVQPRTIL